MCDEVTMVTTQSRILVQSYKLSSSHYAGTRKADSCPVCEGPQESVAHFLISCPALEEIRYPHLSKIKDLLDEFFYQPRSDEHLVLDCSSLT